MALILKVRDHERVYIGKERQIELWIVRDGGQTRIYIEAPRDVPVERDAKPGINGGNSDRRII